MEKYWPQIFLQAFNGIKSSPLKTRKQTTRKLLINFISDFLSKKVIYELYLLFQECYEDIDYFGYFEVVKRLNNQLHCWVSEIVKECKPYGNTREKLLCRAKRKKSIYKGHFLSSYHATSWIAAKNEQPFRKIIIRLSLHCEIIELFHRVLTYVDVKSTDMLTGLHVLCTATGN